MNRSNGWLVAALAVVAPLTLARAGGVSVSRTNRFRDRAWGREMVTPARRIG